MAKPSEEAVRKARLRRYEQDRRDHDKRISGIMREHGVDKQAAEEIAALPPRPGGVFANRVMGADVFPGMTGMVQRNPDDEEKARIWDARHAEIVNGSRKRKEQATAESNKKYAESLRGVPTETKSEPAPATTAPQKAADTGAKEDRPARGVDEGRGTEQKAPPKGSEDSAGKKPVVTVPQTGVSVLEPNKRGGTRTYTDVINGEMVDPSDTVQGNRAAGYRNEAHAAHVRDYFGTRQQEEIAKIRERGRRRVEELRALKASRAQERYNNAQFSDKAGWSNLGLREGERSGASFAEGTSERKAYDARVKAIRDGLKANQEAYGNGLIHGANGNTIAGISKVFEEGVKNGTLSDKQLEALEKKNKGWGSAAADGKRFADTRLKNQQADSARRYLGDAGAGLGREAAIALADAKRFRTVQDAVKGYSSATTDEERFRHQNTLLDHGIDLEAMGSNIVEGHEGMRGRFLKEAASASGQGGYAGIYAKIAADAISKAKDYSTIRGLNTGLGSGEGGMNNAKVAKGRDYDEVTFTGNGRGSKGVGVLSPKVAQKSRADDILDFVNEMQGKAPSRRSDGGPTFVDEAPVQTGSAKPSAQPKESAPKELTPKEIERAANPDNLGDPTALPALPDGGNGEGPLNPADDSRPVVGDDGEYLGQSMPTLKENLAPQQDEDSDDGTQAAYLGGRHRGLVLHPRKG